MMGYYGPWMWLLGTLTMLLFWGGLIVLIVWAVRQFAPGHRPPPVEDPMAILRRRLAAGEITQEQFDQIRRTLES